MPNQEKAMFLNVADLQDPNDQLGRTYRQVNAARRHAIPLGALVELETGERLRVMMHTRDCDQTPLYSLGVTGDDEDEIGRMKWHHGYSEESMVEVPSNTLTDPVPSCPNSRSAIYELQTVLRDLLGQIESCDGTAQLNIERAVAALE